MDSYDRGHRNDCHMGQIGLVEIGAKSTLYLEKFGFASCWGIAVLGTLNDLMDALAELRQKL